MSKDLLKVFLNNLNEKVYLKNINRVNQLNDNCKNLPDSKKMYKLEDLEIKYRHLNLSRYLKNKLRIRVKQFNLLVLPFILVGSTIYSFTKPMEKYFTKKKHCYKVEETVISNEFGAAKLDDKRVVIEDFKIHKYKDENDVGSMDSEYYAYDRIKFIYTDGINGILANFRVDNNGKLSLRSFDSGDYIDLNDYDFQHDTDISSKYANLFDDILNVLKSGDYLTEEQLEKVKNLDNSEKKNIIIKITESTNLGKQDVTYLRLNITAKIILSLICAIYIFCLYSYFTSSKSDVVLKNDNGVLDESTGYPGLFHLGLKYDEAFIAAEMDRINNIIDLSDKLIDYEDRDKILTNFERKRANIKRYLIKGE